LWEDKALHRAAVEFAKLVRAQRNAFTGRRPKPTPDFPEKASNPAVMAAWSYISGMLEKNEVRLKKHFDLASMTGRDPLNAAALCERATQDGP
jgi:hypothetical protein